MPDTDRLLKVTFGIKYMQFFACSVETMTFGIKCTIFFARSLRSLANETIFKNARNNNAWHWQTVEKETFGIKYMLIFACSLATLAHKWNLFYDDNVW